MYIHAVRIHVHVHVHSYTYIYATTHTFTHTYIHGDQPHTSTHTLTHTYTQLHIHLHICDQPWIQTLPHSMEICSVGHFCFAVACEGLAVVSPWILPESAPKSVPPPWLFLFKYYNLSKAYFGGTCDPYRVFGGTRACFLGFLHETQGNMGGTHSREAYVAKKPNRNDHFLQCLATRCSTCVLCDFCKTWKFDAWPLLRAHM